MRCASALHSPRLMSGAATIAAYLGSWWVAAPMLVVPHTTLVAAIVAGGMLAYGVGYLRAWSYLWLRLGIWHDAQLLAAAAEPEA
ncbi:hypothetical protein EPN29_13775 [bacterium]|nr:MAG: hypothetical protein EPN29_13775 [bacterium]